MIVLNLEVITITKEGQPGMNRSEARNFLVGKSKADVVAFIDSDAFPEAEWKHEMLKSFKKGADIVAGREIRMGKILPRVEIVVDGQDITYPAVNLAFRRDVFELLGGFDPCFHVAEDIELLYRAVKAGFKIVYNPKAIVFHMQRDSIRSSAVQSFWYGRGRRQFDEKHGRMLGNTRFVVPTSLNMLARYFFGFFGYVSGRSTWKK